MSILKTFNLLLMLLAGTCSLAKTKITKMAPASTSESLSEYKDCKKDALKNQEVTPTQEKEEPYSEKCSSNAEKSFHPFT